MARQAFPSDIEFLTWLRDRLVHVYKESENVDFVLRLNEIIEELKRNVSD